MTRTRKTREKSDGINNNIQKRLIYLLLTSDLFVKITLQFCLWYFITCLSWGYLKVTCVWVTLWHRQKSLLIFFLWLAIGLSNNLQCHGNMILMKKCNKFKDKSTNTWMIESVILLHWGIFCSKTLNFPTAQHISQP